MKLDAESLAFLFPGWDRVSCWTDTVLGDFHVRLTMFNATVERLRGPSDVVGRMKQQPLPPVPPRIAVGRYRMGKWKRI